MLPFILILLYYFTICFDHVSLQNSSCEIRLYDSKLLEPKIHFGEICSVNYPVQALIKLSGSQNRTHSREIVKEVQPDPTQISFCSKNGPCMFVIRGTGLTKEDAIIILPLNQTECPPTDTLFDIALDHQHFAKNESIIVIRGESELSISNNYLTYVLFHLPDRHLLAYGKHVICYSPARISGYPHTVSLESLSLSSFYYKIESLYATSRNIFLCTFEEETSNWIYDEYDYTQPNYFPCGFFNVRDQYNIDLLWKLGANHTEIPDSGPSNDVTLGYQGYGHYVYMAPPGYSPGATATLMSSPIYVPRNVKPYCVSFSYHMHGVDVSSLRVYIRKVPSLLKGILSQNHVHSEDQSRSRQEQPESNTKTLLKKYEENTDWGSARWIAVGNKGKVWHKGGFEYFAQDVSIIQLIFEGVSGNSEQGYIALDDILVSYGSCSQEIKKNYPKTITGENSMMVCGEVKLNTGLHSADKSWHVEGAISCSGKGYSIDELNSTSWLPCCVPKTGHYMLVLEDARGDGWSGSSLEFRFFNKHFIFNDKNDDFHFTGYQKFYPLVIGSIEIWSAEKPINIFPGFKIKAYVSLPTSFVWCGVIKAKANGNPFNVKLTPEIMKKYGVRSVKRTQYNNELVEIVFSKDIVAKNSIYDVYCYSEVASSSLNAGEYNSGDEITLSRYRVSTDIKPPVLIVESVQNSSNSIELEIKVDESSTIWCLAEKNKTLQFPSTNSKTLYKTLMDLSSNTPEEHIQLEWIVDEFKQKGTQINYVVGSQNQNQEKTLSVVISELTPNTFYNVLCYSEDMALPYSNAINSTQILATYKFVKTSPKVPTVKIVRHKTLYQGFQINIKVDAPGRIWCAMAPEYYETPSIEDVMRVGIIADIDDIHSETELSIYGVEKNTKYTIYCVGGIMLDDNKNSKITSTLQQMEANSVTVLSYGKYCDVHVSEAPIKTVSDITPFHPLSPDEEITVRNFIMSQEELNLKGVYRITLLPNKTEIYNYYEKNGSMPLRYGRVRAGRCVGDVGYYEQFRVGPLEFPQNMSYVRLSQPTLTECGGYVPQGVFGKRRRLDNFNVALIQEFDKFLERSFGYSYYSEECQEDFASHEINKKCLQLGPLIIEDSCSSLASNCERVGTTLWIGLKTPESNPIPLYFVVNFNQTYSFDRINESPFEFSTSFLKTLNHLLFADEQRSENMGSFINLHLYSKGTYIWYNGTIYPDLMTLVNDGKKDVFTPKIFAIHRKRLLQAGRHSLLNNFPAKVEYNDRVSCVRRNTELNDCTENGAHSKQEELKFATDFMNNFVINSSNSNVSNFNSFSTTKFNKNAKNETIVYKQTYYPNNTSEYNRRLNYKISPVKSNLQASDIQSVERSPQVTGRENNSKREGIIYSVNLPQNRSTFDRRQLAPQPFMGAAGTAGPEPSRLTRRGDLEYKAVPEHVEPQGKRFSIEASENQEAFTIKYLGWSMTVINDRDTALRIYNLRFLGKRVAFEIGLMEALAHYSTSERNWFFLDSWYGGLGSAARKVYKGFECPKTGVSLFFDGSLCVFEQDMARPIRSHWKSGEIRDAAPHVSLVLRQILTVSNYDYITDYRFHSTGMFESSISFTGELYAGIEVPWYSSRQKDYGVQVTGAMRFAALHTHMAVWKLDFDIGENDNWKTNSVLLTEIISDPNRHASHKLVRKFAETEKEAAYFRNDTRALIYEIVDESTRIFDNVGGYRLIPGQGSDPKHHNYELYQGPAAWAKYKIASTQRKYSELDANLPRDNKYASKPAVSIDRYVLDNETIRNVDVVSWVSDGIYHVPVVEDMPLTIPIGNTLSWLAKPANLFYEDPSMDLWNSMGGGVEDPGTCAVMRLDISEVEPTLTGTWGRKSIYNLDH